MSEEVNSVAAPESAGAAVESPQVEVTKPVEKVDAQSNGQETAAPSYTPNYKFKVMDEEKEFDEFLRGSIKDQEAEKKARELYEKAYGLDYVKPKYEDLKKRFPELENEYKTFRAGVEDIVSLRDKDFWGFMEAVGLSKEQVAKAVLEEARRLELPEDQKRMYDEFDRTRREKLFLEKQLQEEQWRTQEMGVQERTFQLDTVLQKPEIAAYAKAYDSARKKSGAFREEVVRQGVAEWHVNQRDMTAEQAVSEVMSRLGEHYRGGAATPPTLTHQGSADDKPLPVIPKVGGKSVSPVGKQPRSIEDLKKMAADFS